MRTEIIERTLYQFNELSDKAKEKARDWYREGALDYEWYDSVYEDAGAIAKILGITFAEKKNDRPAIQFSGFSSQGDGASFTGKYAYAKGAHKAIRAYASKDAELARIADELLALQRAANYQLTATIYRHSSHYVHDMTMGFDVYKLGNSHTQDATQEQEDALKEALRGFARWIYRQLEQEHDYLLSAECVDATIIANEYEFEADGTRA